MIILLIAIAMLTFAAIWVFVFKMLALLDSVSDEDDSV